MSTGRPRSCTLEDVAAEAGVSRATVSRVVNGGERVSPAAGAAVERAIDTLGYAPNLAARSLAAHRSDTVALVVSEPSDRLFADPFLGRTIRGVATCLATSRYQLVLAFGRGERDRERIERHLRRGNADGVLLVSVRTDDPLPGRLVAAGIPCVLAGRPPEGVAVAHVDADNAGGARAAVRHLLARGCRTVATVAGPPDMAPGADRLAGWESALVEAGHRADPSLVATGDFSRAGGRSATAALLERHATLDGIFAASDLMAVGAIDAVRAAGRGVPDDVAVVGFDDGDVAETSEPPLTTVRQPIDQMGQKMASLLLAQLAGAPPAEVVLGTDLVVRSSA